MCGCTYNSFKNSCCVVKSTSYLLWHHSLTKYNFDFFSFLKSKLKWQVQPITFHILTFIIHTFYKQLCFNDNLISFVSQCDTKFWSACLTTCGRDSSGGFAKCLVIVFNCICIVSFFDKNIQGHVRRS